MDDILASIRRILHDDPQSQDGAQPGEPDEDDELLLDHSMLVALPDSSESSPAPTPSGPPATPATPAADAPAFRNVPDPSPKDQRPMSTIHDADPAAPPALLGPAAADVTASSMMSLVRAVSADRSAAVHRGGPTIEDLVREEMRPLLKDWLDTHLPPLVERLVRIEIERVVSRVAP